MPIIIDVGPVLRDVLYVALSVWVAIWFINLMFRKD